VNSCQGHRVAIFGHEASPAELFLDAVPQRIGRGRLANLHYNTGHGRMGWTMACGTARICADLIAGRSPDLPLEGLTLR